MPTYYTHVSNPEVRIKVTKKLVTWERLVYVDYDDADKGKVWKHNMHQRIPFYGAETLRTMYNLPDAVVAQLKGLTKKDILVGGLDGEKEYGV